MLFVGMYVSRAAFAIVFIFSLKKREFISGDRSSLQVAKHCPNILGLESLSL